MKKFIYLLSTLTLLWNPLIVSATDYNSAPDVIEAVLDTDYSTIRSGQLNGHATLNTGDATSSMKLFGQVGAEIIVDFLEKLEGSGNFTYREGNSHSLYTLQSILKNNTLYYRMDKATEWESFDVHPESYYEDGTFNTWISIISEQTGTIFNDTVLRNDKLVHFTSSDNEYIIQSKVDMSVDEYATTLLNSIDLAGFKERILNRISKELENEETDEDRDRRIQEYSEYLDKVFKTYFNKEFLTTVLVEVPHIKVHFQKDTLYPTKFEFKMKVNVFNYIKQQDTPTTQTDAELKESGTPNFAEFIVDISLKDYNHDFEINTP